MSRQTTRTVPCMETLEDRLMLSTTVTYTATSINIVGDTTKTGQISVTGNSGGNYAVAVAGETPVVKGTPPAVSSVKVSITISTGNAGRNVVVTPMGAKNVTVNGGAGNDNITVGGNVFGGNVTLNGGDGTNSLIVTFVDIAGNVTINGGKNGDSISIGGVSSVNGSTTINTGDGVNFVTVANATTRGKLTVNGGKDADTVTLGGGSPTQLLGNIGVTTKAGNDSIYVNQGTYGATPLGKSPTMMKFSAGDGNDTIQIGGVSTPGAVVVAGSFSMDAGKGDDVCGIANSSLATTVDFEKTATILLGAGNDFLQIASNHDGNNVLIIGNATIDLGSSLTSGFGDRFGVSVVNTSQFALNGSKNTINFGLGIKNLATPAPGILADSIYLGAGSHTDIKAASNAVISSALKTAIFKGLNTSAANVGVTINLG